MFQSNGDSDIKIVFVFNLYENILKHVLAK